MVTLVERYSTSIVSNVIQVHIFLPISPLLLRMLTRRPTGLQVSAPPRRWEKFPQSRDFVFPRARAEQERHIATQLLHLRDGEKR